MDCFNSLRIIYFAFLVCALRTSSIFGTDYITIDAMSEYINNDRVESLGVIPSKLYDRFYINFDDLDSQEDSFHIHIGDNVWIETSIVHRDETGVYTYNANIAWMALSPSCEYERKWRCPYCYRYWPLGKTCQNSDCPSKYK